MSKRESVLWVLGDAYRLLHSSATYSLLEIAEQAGATATRTPSGGSSPSSCSMDNWRRVGGAGIFRLRPVNSSIFPSGRATATKRYRHGEPVTSRNSCRVAWKGSSARSVMKTTQHMTATRTSGSCSNSLPSMVWRSLRRMDHVSKVQAHHAITWLACVPTNMQKAPSRGSHARTPRLRVPSLCLPSASRRR